MRLVSRSEFSRIAGVSPAAITKSAKFGKLLAASHGKRIDMDHPAAVAYLKSKQVDPTTARPKTLGERRAPTPPRRSEPKTAPPEAQPSPAPKRRARSRKPATSSAPEVGIPLPRARTHVTWDEVDDFPRESMREVARMFGTAQSFKDWLDALKKIEDTREKRLKNEQSDGRLIERELVQIHVFGVMRALTRRLLRDAPKTLARELYAMALAGRPIEDAEKALREGLGSQIQGAKVKAARALGGQGPVAQGDDG